MWSLQLRLQTSRTNAWNCTTILKQAWSGFGKHYQLTTDLETLIPFEAHRESSCLADGEVFSSKSPHAEAPVLILKEIRLRRSC